MYCGYSNDDMAVMQYNYSVDSTRTSWHYKIFSQYVLSQGIVFEQIEIVPQVPHDRDTYATSNISPYYYLKTIKY